MFTSKNCFILIDVCSIDVDGGRYRLVGYGTPETFNAKCDSELALGNAATNRFKELIASGRLIQLAVLLDRDRHGRGLGRLFVAKSEMGDILIGKELARSYWGGRRAGWCNWQAGAPIRESSGAKRSRRFRIETWA